MIYFGTPLNSSSAYPLIVHHLFCLITNRGHNYMYRKPCFWLQRYSFMESQPPTLPAHSHFLYINYVLASSTSMQLILIYTEIADSWSTTELIFVVYMYTLSPSELMLLIWFPVPPGQCEPVSVPGGRGLSPGDEIVIPVPVVISTHSF
jgi:hypothetical protein